MCVPVREAISRGYDAAYGPAAREDLRRWSLATCGIGIDGILLIGGSING